MLFLTSDLEVNYGHEGKNIKKIHSINNYILTQVTDDAVVCYSLHLCKNELVVLTKGTTEEMFLFVKTVKEK